MIPSCNILLRLWLLLLRLPSSHVHQHSHDPQECGSDSNNYEGNYIHLLILPTSLFLKLGALACVTDEILSLSAEPIVVEAIIRGHEQLIPFDLVHSPILDLEGRCRGLHDCSSGAWDECHALVDSRIPILSNWNRERFLLHEWKVGEPVGSERLLLWGNTVELVCPPCEGKRRGYLW